jgi:polyisoprenyl-phosphate glycosyltransferase
MISIISPVYNEEENIEDLVNRVFRAMETTGEEFEIILVENGSNDRSKDIIKRIRAKDERVKYLSLSRNFGHQGGISAGLKNAIGDAVISMDGDLQHPPEILPQMIALWREGNDVVYTTKKEKNTQADWRFYPKRIFYWTINKVSEVQLSFGQSDFRLMDRKVVNVLVNLPEANMFLRGMVEWVGFKQVGIEYEVPPRERGISKFRLLNYMEFAIDGVVSFSILPLRVCLLLGVLIAGLSLLYGMYEAVFGILFLYDPSIYHRPSGYATIIVAVSFLGAIQLISIGVLGEYIGRIYRQGKGRPQFIVDEREL